MAPTVTKRKYWFDPRFAIGLVLIAVSVLGTVFVVSAADSSTEVLVARSALVPGQMITADDLSVSHVRLDSASDLYLEPTDLANDPVVVTRTVSAGELVPVAAVGAEEGLDVTTVVVDLDGQIAESIVAGTTVDLWASSQTEEGGFGPPSVIVGDATVVRLVEPAGIVVDDSAASVELLVPQDSVARVLEAAANDEALSLLPTSLPVKG